MRCRNSARTPLKVLFCSFYAGRLAPFRKRLMQSFGKIVIASQHYPPDQSTTAAIMSAISIQLAREAPVLVLSGMAGSESIRPDSNQLSIVAIKNRLPGKAALIKRAASELLFAVRM